MFIIFKLLLYLIVLVHFFQPARGEKRILLNDPGLIEQRLTHLEHEIQTMKSENQQLKDRINQYETARSADKGAIYIRWGRKHCPNNVSTEIYSGFAAGGWWNDKGSPTNYLCLPPDPISSGKSSDSGWNHLFGVEYETNFWGTHSQDEDAPCAVCSAASESTLLMIPGRSSCYPGWTKQYNGYLGTTSLTHPGAKEYVCVDQSPDYLNAGQNGVDGALFYPVSYQCGALQCPPFTNNEIVNCVVCTK